MPNHFESKSAAPNTILNRVWQAAAGVTLCSLAISPGIAAASALSDAAAGMPQGSFRELKTDGLTRMRMTGGGCSSPVTSYSDRAVWDNAGRSLLFIGGPHGCPHVFLKYDELTNSWSNLPTFSNTKATHGYDHMALDAAAGLVYFRVHGKGGIHSYKLASESWQVDALPVPSAGFTQVSGGLEYFPETDSLVHVNYGGHGEVHVFQGDSWIKKASFSMGAYQNFIEYNPNLKLLLFGGGWEGTRKYSHKLYQMDSRGKLSRKNDAPIGLGIMQTIITVDPLSGKFLVFGNGKEFYEYDALEDSWNKIERSVPFLNVQFQKSKEVVATVAASVPLHGIVMFLQYLSEGKGGSKLWLYKHCPTIANCEAPSLATDLPVTVAPD